jgi:hypothetical protein
MGLSLLVARFRELLRGHLVGVQVDGVEDHQALDIPADTSLALHLEPSSVGQSAVDGSFTP